MSNSWIACLGIHSFPPNSVHPYPVLFTSNLRNPVPSRQAGSLVLLGTLVGLSPSFFRRPLCSKTKAAFYLLPTKPYLDFAGFLISNCVCLCADQIDRDLTGANPSQKTHQALYPFNLLIGYGTDSQQTASLKQSM